MRRKPVLVPWMTWTALTLLFSISSLTRVNSRGFSSLGRWMVMWTAVPGSPRSFPTISSSFLPFWGSPSMVRIWSPARIPALAAGVSRRTEETVSSPSWRWTWTPIPPKVSPSSFSNSLYSSGVMNSLKGSRETTIPLMAFSKSRSHSTSSRTM